MKKTDIEDFTIFSELWHWSITSAIRYHESQFVFALISGEDLQSYCVQLWW